MSRSPRLIKPNPSFQSESNSIDFVTYKDWESIFIEALRYRAGVNLSWNHGSQSFQTMIRSYRLDLNKDTIRPEHVQFAVEIDRANPVHESFVSEIRTDSFSSLDFRIHLPRDLIRFKATIIQIEKLRCHFQLQSPPFRIFSRQYARVGVRVPVFFSLFFNSQIEKDRLVKAESIDISSGGMGFILREESFRLLPQIGEEIPNLHFKLGGKSFHISALIRHVALIQQNQFPQKRFRIGVEFIHVSPDIRTSLEELIRFELDQLTLK